MVINTTTLAFQQTFMWLFTIFSSLLLVYQGLDEISISAFLYIYSYNS